MEKVTHVPIAREALIDKYPDVFGEHQIRVMAPEFPHSLDKLYGNCTQDKW